LKGAFVNIERKFLRVMGRVNMTVLLAPTIFGYNLECIRSFLEEQAVEDEAKAAKKTRKKRVNGRTQILGPQWPGRMVWDFRRGFVPLHGHLSDPVEQTHGSRLHVASATPWRWPWKLNLTQRIELVRAE